MTLIMNNTINTTELTACGNCSQLASAHTDHYRCLSAEEFGPYICDRDFETFEIIYGHDFQILDENFANPTVFIYEDYQGSAARDYITDDYDPAHSGYGESYWSSVDNWSDNDPTYRTIAKDWWYIKPNHQILTGTYSSTDAQSLPTGANSVEPAQRNAYVEGIEGFLTVQVYDLTVTNKFHDKLVNAYLKNGNLRIGSIEIGHPGNDLISATCVNSKCSYKDEHGNWNKRSLSINPLTATREEQEWFIFQVIAHGNNHAANWFVTRPTFYSISQEFPLQRTEDSFDLTNSQERVNFLKAHQTYCRSNDCLCNEWLLLELNVHYSGAAA